MINIAILGYGTIGKGTHDVLEGNAAQIAHKVGDELHVKRVLDLRDFPGDRVSEILTHDFDDILHDKDISIVVETMGGTGAAYTFVKAALSEGKSVVTSNKALVAAFGPELLQIAAKKNVSFLFEASVGGGIPIIRPLLSCLGQEEIVEISGILNGTTNYILTKMTKDGGTYEEILKEAKELGYAEADPTADVEGHDACRKIAILAALAYGRFVDFNDIPCKGITQITLDDIAFAKEKGMKVKLIASARLEGGEIYAEVSPVMIGPESPLYSVDDVMNAVMVKGNMVGELMFYGAGAGALPTASAVVADIIEAAKSSGENVFIEMEPEKIELSDSAKLKSRFYVRADKPLELLKGKSEGITELLTGSDLLKDLPDKATCIKIY